MTTHRILAHMTPKRREWLEHLERDGPTKPERGTVTHYQCRKLGWTEWLLERDGDRERRSVVEVQYPDFPAMWHAGWRFTEIETITDAGRAALEASRG